MTVNASALAQNATLTLAGSAAEVVTGLVGNLNVGALTGALNVTTGDASDNNFAITTGSGTTSITASGNSDIVTVNAAALAENATLTLAGSAAEVVTGLVGNLNVGALTGALNLTTGDASDNSFAITTGSGATSITANGANDTVTINASALGNGWGSNAVLTLSGSAAETVTGLVADLNASALTGALNVTTGDASDNTIAITTGSGATSISASGNSDIVTVNATALAENATLTLSGSAAETVTGLVGNLNVSALTGALNVTTGNALDDNIAIATGAGAISVTASGANDTVIIDATLLANNTALTLAGSAAEVVSGLIGNINAASLTGALSVNTGDATDNTIAISTGSAATSITDNFSSDTVTVNAAALAQNTLLSLSGSAAETVTGLIGNLAAGSLTGALNVTTGDANDNGIAITTGSAATSISASGNSDIVTVNATALAENATLTLSGSAAETVTGLVGNLNVGVLTGALNLTTGDASDNSFAITTGSGATSITANGANDTVTINASALGNGWGSNAVLTLSGSAAAATVTLGSNGSLVAGTYSGNLIVNGGTGANTITGGSGTNTIIGGGGADTLNGGSGADYFVFRNTSELDPVGERFDQQFCSRRGFYRYFDNFRDYGNSRPNFRVRPDRSAQCRVGSERRRYGCLFQQQRQCGKSVRGRHGRCAQVNFRQCTDRD